jgi:hypothetical protein
VSLIRSGAFVDRLTCSEIYKESHMTATWREGRATDERVKCLRIIADSGGETHMEDIEYNVTAKKAFSRTSLRCAFRMTSRLRGATSADSPRVALCQQRIQQAKGKFPIISQGPVGGTRGSRLTCMRSTRLTTVANFHLTSLSFPTQRQRKHGCAVR